MPKSLSPALLLALLLAAAFVATPLRAQEPMTREAALAALGAADPVERGRAIVTLARSGAMADTLALVARLRDPHPELRPLAEQALWILWSRSGDPGVDALFEQGLDQMSAGRFPEGIATFTRIIGMKPDFAEGWNKRATIYFLAGDLQRSLADCAEVIKRNPSHFGALAGYGQIYMQLGEYEKARDYFRRALAVNPNLDGVEFNLRLIEKALEGRRNKGA
jgi:tetratricopeptide (TPR) repeat protein